MRLFRPLPCLILLVLCLRGLTLTAAETFTVATYNVENYLAEKTGTRPAKSAEAKAKIRESILAMKPDVLALQEMGGTNMLLQLRDSLKQGGLDLPYWEHVSGFDTNIQVAVLSRFPFTARHPHTNESYLLNGRRLRVSRGFAELEVQVNPHYQFTLIAAHLKSKLPIAVADEAEMREQEAILLREKIEARLKAEPNLNLIVLGDFNDTKNSKAIKTIIARGKFSLVDTRPAERNGDTLPGEHAGQAARNITWTHYYGTEDSYSRIDYLLISHGMAREWKPEGTYVLNLPNWGQGSDHRPIIATFSAEDQ